MLISSFSNAIAKQLIARLSFTTLPLILSLVLIVLPGILIVDDAHAQDDIALASGNPNEIDTVFFTISDHVAKIGLEEVGLTFWARECTNCILSGLLNSNTVLINADGNSVSIRLLRKDKKYEAIAIVYAKGSDGLIDRIMLSEPL